MRDAAELRTRLDARRDPDRARRARHPPGSRQRARAEQARGCGRVAACVRRAVAHAALRNEQRSTRAHDGRAAPRRAAQRQRGEARADARHGRREAAGHARAAARRIVQASCPTGWSRCIAAWARCRSLAVGVGDLKRVLAQREDARHVGRGAARRAPGRSADAAAVRDQRRDDAAAATSASSSRSACPAAATIGSRAGCRSTPSSRSTTGSACRRRSSAPTCAAADGARKALAERLRGEAKTIRDKYVAPPYTTDFAILFVPTEGLYAEMMARPGFADALQREYRVTLCGPTNLLGAAQQPAARLPHAGDRAAQQRSVARAGRGARPSSRKFGDVARARARKLDSRRAGRSRRRGVRRRRRSRASCATSRRFPEPRRSALLGTRGAVRRRRAQAPATPSRPRARHVRHATGAGASSGSCARRRIPDGLWRESLESLPFLAIYTDAELARLREKVVLFLDAKSIVGARGHRVTPRQRVVIALQACVLVLEPRPHVLRRLGERGRLSRTSSCRGGSGRTRRGSCTPTTSRSRARRCEGGR